MAGGPVAEGSWNTTPSILKRSSHASGLRWFSSMISHFTTSLCKKLNGSLRGD